MLLSVNKDLLWNVDLIKLYQAKFYQATIFIYTKYEDEGERMSYPWLYNLVNGKDGLDHE